MTSAYPDIEGQLYTSGAPDGTYTEAEARQRAASHREVKGLVGTEVAAAVAPFQSQVSALSSRVDKTLTDAKAYTDGKVDGLRDVVEELGIGGSGIETVSGTVTLDDTGPAIREFYATAAATVQGEPLAKGEAAMFRRIDGLWEVMVLAASGAPRDTAWRTPGAPDLRTPVTPAGPNWSTLPEGGGSWTTPTQVGVIYSPASGTALPGQTVTITASASDPSKYRLVGTTTWTKVFADPNAPILDDFSGPAGTSLAGRKVSSGNATWATTPSDMGVTTQWALTGEGSVKITRGAARSQSDIPLASTLVDMSVTLTAGMTGRASLGFGNYNSGVCLARVTDGNTVLFNKGAVVAEEPGLPATGTFRLVNDGTTITAYFEDTQVGQVATPGTLPQYATIESSGQDRTLSNLKILKV